MEEPVKEATEENSNVQEPVKAAKKQVKAAEEKTNVEEPVKATEEKSNVEEPVNLMMF